MPSLTCHFAFSGDSLALFNSGWPAPPESLQIGIVNIRRLDNRGRAGRPWFDLACFTAERRRAEKDARSCSAGIFVGKFGRAALNLFFALFDTSGVPLLGSRLRLDGGLKRSSLNVSGLLQDFRFACRHLNCRMRGGRHKSLSWNCG